MQSWMNGGRTGVSRTRFFRIGGVGSGAGVSRGGSRAGVSRTGIIGVGAGCMAKEESRYNKVHSL